MNSIALKNRTFHKALIVCSFVLLLLVSPITISLRNTTQVVEVNTSFAADETKSTSAAGEANRADHFRDASKETSWEATLGAWLGNGLLSIGALFTGIGGWLLDESIKNLVVGMGQLVTKDSGIGKAVNEVWGTIRDFGNLIFIFGFIYIGIRTILQGMDNAGTKRFLAQLVMAALLINFSLFFTKVVIDVSNVFAVEVYDLLGNNGEGSLGTTIAKQAGLTSMYDTQQGNVLASATTGGGIAFFVMGFLFLLIAAFVFAAGAVMIIIRFVALIFIMIFSPLMFALLVFPQTKKFAEKISSSLISYAFFAPIFLFLIYVSLRILQATTGTPISGGSFSSTLQNTFSSVFIQFTIAIIFLILSLKVAQELSLVGGNQVVKVGNALRGSVQGYVGRGSVGRIGDKWAKRREEKGKSTTSTLSRVALSAAGAKFGSGYSRTQTREAGEKAGRIQARNKQVEQKVHSVQMGIAAPAGSAGDAQRIAMERAVAGASTEQLVAMLKADKPGTARGDAIIANMSASQFDNIMKVKDEDLDDSAKANIARVRTQKIKESVQNAAQEAHKKANPAGTPPLSDADALRNGISKASAAQLKVLGSQTLEANAGDLTATQIDDLKKGSDFTETEKTRIIAEHERQLIDRFTTAATRATVFTKKKDKDIAKLPKQILTSPEAVPFLTAGTMEQIHNEQTLTSVERRQVRANILAAGPHPALAYFATPRGQSF